MGVSIEGSPFSNLLKLMQTQGYNKDSHIVIGKVSSISPLSINLGAYSISNDHFLIAERLTEHTRDITMTVDETNPTQTPYQITKGTLTIKSPLKVGDFVIVLIDENEFFIIDRVVS